MDRGEGGAPSFTVDRGDMTKESQSWEPKCRTIIAFANAAREMSIAHVIFDLNPYNITPVTS